MAITHIDAASAHTEYCRLLAIIVDPAPVDRYDNLLLVIDRVDERLVLEITDRIRLVLNTGDNKA